MPPIWVKFQLGLIQSHPLKSGSCSGFTLTVIPYMAPTILLSLAVAFALMVTTCATEVPCLSSAELDPFTGTFLCPGYCNNQSVCDICENCVTLYDAKDGPVCPQRCADWAALGWGKCSTSCGPGNHTRVVRCVSDLMSWKPSAVRLPCDRAMEPPSIEGCRAAVRAFHSIPPSQVEMYYKVIFSTTL